MPYKFDKLSILVVDDAAPVLDVTARALEILGVGRVLKAKDGPSAFDTYVRERPDIILTDWEMTPMDGLDLIKKIRNDELSPKRNVPIIMMTGYTASARVAKARDYGITEFLVKPFTANELSRRIAYVIDNPRDFVETEQFFGPDRRRRKSMDYDGEGKRDEDDE